MLESADPTRPRTLPTPEMDLPDKAVQLTDVQVEIIDLFVHLLQAVGLPKSAGEIYGLLFASAGPMTFDDIMAKLNISGGSVSQGLRMLRSLGAVRTAYVAGDRRDYYLAETDLRKLAAGFLRENVEHHLSNGQERLLRLNEMVSRGESISNSSREFFEERIETLRSWNERAQAILPIVIQVLH